MSEPVVRIAARGEGVTASGRHVPLSAPGDLVEADGRVVPGPAHQTPPCVHFSTCGGCQLQHLTDAAYADYVAGRVVGALAAQGLEAPVAPALLSPPRSRRRASLRALRAGKRVLLGFNGAQSHQIIDLAECHVLDPALFALIAPLRALLAMMLPARGNAEVQMTLADQGVDLQLKGVTVEGLDAIEALTAFGVRHRLARISVDEGYGAEPLYEPEPVTITLGGVAVGLPSGAFLQATPEGEAQLVAAVRSAIAGARHSADLFAGLGTFALSIDGVVTAAEASRDAILSLKSAAARAGRPVTAEHRNLYRRPYQPDELAAFDAVVLDPPRSGAEEQVKALAAIAVARIAYVSCNPATFARDAAVLTAGGYRLERVQPVGQFRWSTHVELAATFTR